MNLNAKIYVAGHGGLVGSALLRRLRAKGYTNIATRTHAKLDLTDQVATEVFFATENPEFVFLAAAKVGGILANNIYPADFISINLAIQNNVIQAASRHSVKRLLFLGSSCIYPRDCPQPIKEEYFLSGLLEPTNRSYAIAKIAGIEQCWSYNRQNGTQFLAVMPTNVYGRGDSYDLVKAHVIPALIRKFHEAKTRGDNEAVVWGTGAPKREFLYCDDLADACVFLMCLPNETFNSILNSQSLVPPIINIGCGKDITICELAEIVKRVISFEGKIIFDPSKPDGTPRKVLDSGNINKLGWVPKIELLDGISKSYEDFVQQFLPLSKDVGPAHEC
ncbi:MAG: GDP-L-fucose synthase [Betaproteobacteria bacterium]|nr:MAG: GDP-L-fucose synthase [Betaproteobacteria bacterium]